MSLEKGSHETAKFDLIFSATETEGILEARFQFCRDLFLRSKMEQMIAHFKQLLQSIIITPQERIDQLNILSAVERHQLLETYTATDFDFPADKTLTQLFEEQAALTPDQIALSFEEKELRFSEVNKIANQLGDFLRQQYDIKADDRIAIQLERSEWMILAIFGVLKSGGAYVPIDPQYPEERIQYMLKDSESKVCIDATLLEEFKAVQAKYSTDNPSPIADARKLSYIIYTSGSTGQPKGVLTEHRSVVNELTYQRLNFGLASDDRILQTANYVFDASIEQIFLPLLFGARLVLIPRETLLDPNALDRVLQEKEITHLHATPSLLQSLTPKAYPNLRRVLAGGELCTLELARPWSEHVRFFNKYGPTETTINSTIYEYDEATASEQLTGLPIGKPLGNTRIYILDAYRNLVPPGVIGEVYIGGVGVSRGYLQKEDLTQEKFIASPFAVGDRLYRTGDLARWLPNGLLEFRGRVDFQVKVRGYRIELGEIEKVLEQSAAVQQAVVIARADGNGSNQLVAYVLPEGDFDASKIKEELKNRLPEYMIPSLIIELAELPLTPNGKVDKRALPDPEEAALGRSRLRRSPQ